MSNKKIIIQIIGDSLSLHRQAEGISYEDTYPQILKNAYGYDIIYSTDYGKKTSDAYQIEKNADYVIIHLGLVDCFPRVHAKKIKNILFYLPFQLRHMVTYFHRHHRYHITRMFPITTTSVTDFSSNIGNMLHDIKISGATPLVIDIVNVSDEAASRNYGANENIKKYNECLSKMCLTHDCSRIRLNYATKHYPQMLHTDGQHLSKFGHQVLAGLIFKTIEAL